MSGLRILGIESWSWTADPKPEPSPLQKWASLGVTVHRIGMDLAKGHAFNELMSHSVARDTLATTAYTPHGMFSDRQPPDTSIMAVAGTLEMMIYAEKQGYDAAFVPCFADTGVVAGRSMVDIPLVGACEASLHLASMLGHNFSVIVNFPTDIPNVTLAARSHGLDTKIKSFRSLDMSTIERGGYFTRGDPEENKARLISVARKAVEIDGAEVIVGACTSAGWFELAVQDEIGVPVVDPAVAVVKMACFMADLYRNFGLSHSRVGGYFPRGTFFG